MNRYSSVDLFAGCGGLSEGMRLAGFDIKVAIDIDKDSALTYAMNHPNTTVIQKDIRETDVSELREWLGDETLHLLAGCPPCQGFSSVRRLNKKKTIYDPRNRLILEYLRFVEGLEPYTIMLENVPGLADYYLFTDMLRKLRKMGYHLKFGAVNVKDYGVPQSRKRLVLVGSVLGEIAVAEATGERVTVRTAIGGLESISTTHDPLHRMTTRHTQRIKDMIARIPKDGGSRKDLPDNCQLKCHTKENVGFDDIYGRLRWDDYSSTITAGCLNPSKGRFLHPYEDRVITAREALILQSFPITYKFRTDITKKSLSSMIGEALPPKFSYIQSKNVADHLDAYCAR